MLNAKREKQRQDRKLVKGTSLPSKVRIDWHEDAVIVTVAVVKPKCLDLDYRKHCGQVLGEMKLPPATTQLCEHAYLTDPAELWSQPDPWTRFAQAGLPLTNRLEREDMPRQIKMDNAGRG